VYNRLTGKTQVGKAMCGIVGYLDKKNHPDFPIGRTLLGMLQALSCRGPDSAGVALYGPPSDWHIRLSSPEGSDSDTLIGTLRKLGFAVHRRYDNGVYDAVLSKRADIATLESQIQLHLPGCEIICLGQCFDLFKQVGSPQKLEKTYGISKLTGSHGIGHTRLSTESRVDLSHSQPFWAHGVPDLATVHNGHITNYHKLRRAYEQAGYRFYTENDSEVIGVYLRSCLENQLSLEDALQSSMDYFDGSFSYLAASGDMLAYVRDRYGFKPLMVAETDDYVAIATEEIALRQTLGADFVAREVAPGTVGIWRTQQPVLAAS
jgi:glutamate synthase domain-containing protein 1